MTGLTRTVAAATWVGGDAVVTGASALALHGLLRTAPSAIELLLPDHRRTIEHPRIRTRWTLRLEPAAVTHIAGTPVADVARSLADHAGEVSLTRLRSLALDAASRRLLAPGHMERELACRQRFPGRTHYRRVRFDLEGDGSESGFEFSVRDRLAAAGLVPDRDQAELTTPAGTRRIDIAFSPELVGIDCVGFAYHSSPRQLEEDVVRGNAIAVLDRWLVLRLTFAMFHQRWEPFLAQLRHCLDQRRAAVT